MGVLFVDDTNLWEGLGENDDLETVMEKGQSSINSWGSNLMAVGGELQPIKCSYTVHQMKPTKDGEWEYVKEKPVTWTNNIANPTEDLDDLWEDLDEDELDDLDSPGPGLTIPQADGDAATIKKTDNRQRRRILGHESAARRV